MMMFATLATAHPHGQVDHELDELEDLLAVENQIDKSVVAIAPAPPDFLGERLVSIAPAPKDFPGERLTSTKEEEQGTYACRSVMTKYLFMILSRLLKCLVSGSGI